MRPTKLGIWRQVIRTIRFVLSPEAGTVPKILAIAVVAYLVSPFDLLIGPLDDAMIVWGAYMFLEHLMRRQDSAPRGTQRDAIDTTARLDDEDDTEG